MSIPVGMDYTSTVEGSVIKHVTCEQCQLPYVYVATRRASGRGSSLLFMDNSGAQERAQDRAGAALKKLLDQAVEPVPCLGCGWMQQDMVREARQRFHRWLFVTGLLTAFISALILPICYVSRLTKTPLFLWAAVGVVVGLLLIGLRAILLGGYHPNSPQEAERWSAKTAGTAMTLDDFEALRARQEAEEQADRLASSK